MFVYVCKINSLDLFEIMMYILIRLLSNVESNVFFRFPYSILYQTYNPGQKSLGHCTFKQGNAITLERQTLGRRFYAQGPPPPQPMLKYTGSILASGLNIVWVGGRGGLESYVFCSPDALLYRKIPKCPKTFGQDCRPLKCIRSMIPFLKPSVTSRVIPCPTRSLASSLEHTRRP